MPKESDIGPIQTYLADSLKKVPKLLLHPLWGLLVATLITISGRGELLFKSIGILLAALWLIVDTWFRIVPTSNRYRIIFGWAVTNLLLISVMGAMYWWLNGMLEDQQDDVFSDLAVQFSMPVVVPQGERFKANATVVNGGHYEIGKHAIECGINRLVFNNNSGPRGGIDGLGMNTQPPSGLVIGPSGDGETNSCTSGLVAATDINIICGDVTVYVDYSLTDQPQIMKTKRFRFVSNQLSNFAWKPQPVGYKADFCQREVGREKQ